jgi:hypothetical protein
VARFVAFAITNAPSERRLPKLQLLTPSVTARYCASPPVTEEAKNSTVVAPSLLLARIAVTVPAPALTDSPIALAAALICAASKLPGGDS